MQLTIFSKLKIIHTPGKNLTVADMLSKTFMKEQLQLHQLRHKQLPPQIDFSNMKFSQKDYLKNYKISLTKDKLNMYQHYLNHQYHSTHLFDMLILKTSLMKK